MHMPKFINDYRRSKCKDRKGLLLLTPSQPASLDVGASVNVHKGEENRIYAFPNLSENKFTLKQVFERWTTTLNFVIDDATACKPFSRALSLAMSWDDEFTALATLEYKKFMFLCSLFPQASLTPSLHVDTVWHMHLLYTRSYHQFCKEALGCRFFHHEPSTGEPSEQQFHEDSYSNTVDLYESYFGLAPIEFWGKRVRTDLTN
jgi:hypothetical protein